MSEKRNYKSVSAARKAQERQRENILHAIEMDKADEQTGEVLGELMMDPTADIEDIAKRYGMTPAMVRGLRAKVQTTLQPVTTTLRRATNARMLELIEDRQLSVMEAMTDSKIQKAGLREQVYALDRLFNIRQLLRGEPTQIVSIDDRKTLNELVPALVKAAQRRGIIIDGIGRTLEEPQRGIPDSRVQAETVIESSAVLTAASEGADGVRGGVVEGTSLPETAGTVDGRNPNDPPSGRALDGTPETAGSTDP